jgi:hypothetical protein
LWLQSSELNLIQCEDLLEEDLVAVIVRIVQQFQPAKRQQFIDLEKQFAGLEHRGILPRGERMTPISSRDPGNTIIWQGRFNSLAAAETALKLFETSPEHTELANQQVHFFTNSWVELYELLEY